MRDLQGCDLNPITFNLRCKLAVLKSQMFPDTLGNVEMFFFHENILYVGSCSNLGKTSRILNPVCNSKKIIHHDLLKIDIYSGLGTVGKHLQFLCVFFVARQQASTNRVLTHAARQKQFRGSVCVLSVDPARHRDTGIQDVDVATLPFKHENNKRKQRLHNQMDLRFSFFYC